LKIQQDASSHLSDQSEIVDFCAMVDKPARYRGRQIRFKAVLVENNRPRVDGADSFIYDAACRNKKRRVMVTWRNYSYDKITARESLGAIQAKSDEFGISRAAVALSGTLNGPGKEKFGHLNWAELEFNIDDVEQAEPVAANLPWPKWVEDAYRKARKLMLAEEKKRLTRQ
jgi:hypothetical protein